MTTRRPDRFLLERDDDGIRAYLATDYRGSGVDILYVSGADLLRLTGGSSSGPLYDARHTTWADRQTSTKLGLIGREGIYLSAPFIRKRSPDQAPKTHNRTLEVMHALITEAQARWEIEFTETFEIPTPLNPAEPVPAPPAPEPVPTLVDPQVLAEVERDLRERITAELKEEIKKEQDERRFRRMLADVYMLPPDLQREFSDVMDKIAETWD